MDPFRDDRTALRVRIEELEEQLSEARQTLDRVSEPHTTLAKALKKSKTDARIEAERVEELEATLADLRDRIVKAREELAQIKDQLGKKK